MKKLRLLTLSFLFISSALAAQKPTAFTLSIEAKQPIVETGKPVIVVVTRKNTTDQVINDTRTTNPMEFLTFYISRDGIPVQETEAHKRMHRSTSGRDSVITSSP